MSPIRYAWSGDELPSAAPTIVDEDAHDLTVEAGAVVRREAARVATAVAVGLIASFGAADDVTAQDIRLAEEDDLTTLVLPAKPTFVEVWQGDYLPTAPATLDVGEYDAFTAPTVVNPDPVVTLYDQDDERVAPPAAFGLTEADAFNPVVVPERLHVPDPWERDHVLPPEFRLGEDNDLTTFVLPDETVVAYRWQGDDLPQAPTPLEVGEYDAFVPPTVVQPDPVVTVYDQDDERVTPPAAFGLVEEAVFDYSVIILPTPTVMWSGGGDVHAPLEEPDQPPLPQLPIPERNPALDMFGVGWDDEWPTPVPAFELGEDDGAVTIILPDETAVVYRWQGDDLPQPPTPIEVGEYDAVELVSVPEPVTLPDPWQDDGELYVLTIGVEEADAFTPPVVADAKPVVTLYEDQDVGASLVNFFLDEDIPPVLPRPVPHIFVQVFGGWPIDEGAQLTLGDGALWTEQTVSGATWTEQTIGTATWTEQIPGDVTWTEQ